MLIEVRTDGNIQGSEQFSEEVKTVVQTALDRFGSRIRRIDVHLSDATGNKAGHDDKCCKIEARRDGREPIVVTQHETTMDQAIRGAVHSLKRSVESAFGKNPIWIISGIITRPSARDKARRAKKTGRLRRIADDRGLISSPCRQAMKL